MAQFLVDARTLLALRDLLGRLGGRLTAMPTVVSESDRALGGGGLGPELDRFSARWHGEVTSIADRIAAIMVALVAAAAAYERVERRLAAAHGTSRRVRSGAGTTTVDSSGGVSVRAVSETAHGAGAGTTVVD